jgi:hypothetical protein
MEVVDLSDLRLDGNAASAFFGPDLADLVGDKPVEMKIHAAEPPRTIFDDDQPPFLFNIENFNFNLYGPIDERSTRLLEVNMRSKIRGIIELSDDELVTDALMDSSDFSLTEGYSELIKPGFSENMPQLLDLALGGFSPSVPDFSIPTFMEISVKSLAWGPNPEGTWQGGYLFLDIDNVEPLTVPGCNASDLGCEDGGSGIDIDLEEQLGCSQAQSGCDGGCVSGGKIRLPAGRIFGLFFVVFGALIRRRR